MLTDSTPAAKIAAQEAEVARLRRDLEIAEAVLRGMHMIATQNQSPIIAQTAELRLNAAREADQELDRIRSEVRKGRQPGAISHQWRDTLHMLHMNYRDGFTEY